jgi:PKD repeat protein
MRIAFTLAVLLFGSVAFAQAPVFKGEPVTPLSRAELDAQFGAYEVYKIDISTLNHYVKQAPGTRAFRLDLHGGPDWDLEIYAHDIRSQDYTLQAQEEHGLVYYPVSEIKTFRGSLAQQPENIASLTFDHEFIYGFIREGDEEWFIEPLWYFIPEAARDLFVVYPASKVIPVEGKTCGVDEVKHRVGQLEKHEHEGTPETGNCYRLELAIASDWSMRQKYGSVAAVETHNIGVMNNVAANYDNEFSDEINFFIVTQFVSNCSTCDPWTSSTDPEVLLDDFTDWGPTNFGVTHDLGQLWTNRDFDGGTVGIAWLNAVCTSFRYHCLQDFTTNANFLRVMTAHEIGHNFSAEHDAQGSPYIMAPTVQNTDIWSALSISDMNSFILQIDPPQGCLTLCPPPLPPAPAFTANITNLCSGSFVTFFDESTNLPSSWSWSMPGATPSSSTERSPTVIYNNPGVYNVTLTVTNANGTNSLTKPAYIVVSGSTGTDFFFFEGFENGVGSWTVQNPDNGITWANTSVNGTRQGSKAMMLDNINYGSSGHRDGLISPTFSLFGRNNAVLEIEYAYARYNATRRDSLIVYISTNNGASYTRLFAATETGNGAFATRADLTTPFNPASTSEWCFGTGGPNCLSLNLAAYTGFTNCKIKIENYTGRGNRMYIDNVRILSACELAVPPTANFTGIPTSGCAPLQVVFQDQSTNTPQSWSWSFPGALPPSSTLQNPIVLFPTPGNYSVTLTVTNPAGSNSITKTNYITVGGPPTAQFSYTVNGSTLTVTNQSSPNATSFTWNFGDGTTSNLQNPPPHTYANDGAFVVTLTATNACGTSTFPQTVLIETPPTAGFTASPLSGCAPLTVNFTDQSSPNVLSWSWSFPGGTPSSSTLENPVVTYNAPGVYDVQLIVTNTHSSDTLLQNDLITVNPGAVAAFAASVNGTVVSFTNNSSNALSYLWDFGDGNTSTETNPVYDYGQNGAFEVALTAYGDCDTVTVMQTVEPELVLEAPQAGFSTPNTSGCTPFSVQFTDESTNSPSEWSWTFEGGTPATSSEQNPLVEYLTPGVFDVTLIASNAVGSDTISFTAYITVDVGPTAAFSSSVNGTIASFTNNSSNALSYFWDFGDGATSTAANPSHDFGTDGEYTVMLIATNDCGPDTATAVVVIVTPPVAGFSADVTEGCVPLSVQFTNASSANAASWSWTFEGGAPATSSEENPVVQYLSPGVYGVTLTVSNAAGSDTYSEIQYITANDGPSAGYTYSVSNFTTVDFGNTSSNATEYLWDFGDGNTSAEAEPQHSYAGDGTYIVVLIATNACGSDTTETVLEIVTPPLAGFTADITEGCAPLTVQFTSESSPNAVSWNWAFEGGTPATSSEEHPEVQYLNPGVFGVTLTVSNGAGESTEEIAGYIQVNSQPAADFNFSANGLTVDFSNTSSGATSYLWDFGDGTTSVEADPQHTFPGAGGYDITLIAANDCGSDTTSVYLELLLPPTAGFSADQTEGCAPMTVQFTNESSANAISWSWTFEGGVPASSTEENPVVQYLNPGSYGVTLTVTNAAGEDTESVAGYIVVNTGPAASFDVSVAGSNVTFSNSSTNAGGYFWDFGDGATSTESDPAHSYAEDGMYEVVLIATNACGSDTVTAEVVVVTPPVAGFTADDTEGCAPLTVHFTNQSSENAASWLWTFEGGSPASSTQENPVVQYLNAGTFGVTLTVSNAAGEDEISFTNYITVLPDPVASFSADVNGSVVTFTNNSSNGNTYLWDFGDGTGSTQPNPQHTYTQDGVFTVKLTVFNSCGTSVFTQQVAIATLGPLALFSASPVEGCGPLTVQFNNLSSDNSESFEWFFPGGTPATSTAFNPVVVYNQPGTYDVTLIAYNPNGSDEASQTGMITVLPPPTADFDFTISNGATVLFSNASSGASTYSWSFGDGASSTLANPVHTYSQIGTFLVELIVEGECGTNATTQVVGINQVIPTAAFSANPVSGCAPVTVQFSDQTNGNPGSWNWEFPGGEPSSSTEQHPVVTYAAAGQYTVTLQVSNAAGSDVLMQSGMVTVSDVPAPAFTWEALPADPLTISFTNTTTGANSFFWDFGDGQTSSLNSPTHNYDAMGDYTVVFTATNGCGDAVMEEVIALVSVREAGLFEKLLIFPNPNKGQFTVVVESPLSGAEPVQLRLFNALGQQLMSQETILQEGKGAFQVEQAGLATGLYWIEIQIGDQRTGRKIVVE